jgi:hypothetical protein
MITRGMGPNHRLLTRGMGFWANIQKGWEEVIKFMSRIFITNNKC